MARLSLEERLNRIEDKISEKSFRENKGLGNEVGYYVFDYDPRAELEVRNHIAYLKDRINWKPSLIWKKTMAFLIWQTVW